MHNSELKQHIIYWIRIIKKILVSMLHWNQYVSVIRSRRKSSQPNYMPCNEPPALRLCRWMFMKWARNALILYVHTKVPPPHTHTRCFLQITLLLSENFKTSLVQKKQACIHKFARTQSRLNTNFPKINYKVTDNYVSVVVGDLCFSFLHTQTHMNAHWSHDTLITIK